MAYAADVTHTAERINQRFGTDGWTPIALHTDDDRARSLAALRISDVLLVNPVRDGLNLVAKEGPLLNDSSGVLVLSREAGAWEELAATAAIGVNPFDISGTADALHRRTHHGEWRAGRSGPRNFRQSSLPARPPTGCVISSAPHRAGQPTA